LIEINLNPI
ncbi:unnamed protein product, partial [Rotaria sp. Silwood1]